jgi:hypothetical protein
MINGAPLTRFRALLVCAIAGCWPETLTAQAQIRL